MLSDELIETHHTYLRTIYKHTSKLFWISTMNKKPLHRLDKHSTHYVKSCNRILCHCRCVDVSSLFANTTAEKPVVDSSFMNMKNVIWFASLRRRGKIPIESLVERDLILFPICMVKFNLLVYILALPVSTVQSRWLTHFKYNNRDCEVLYAYIIVQIFNDSSLL